MRLEEGGEIADYIRRRPGINRDTLDKDTPLLLFSLVSHKVGKKSNRQLGWNFRSAS